MSNNLIIYDKFLVALAKSGGLFPNLSQLLEYLLLWHGISKYINKVLFCLQINHLNQELEINLPFWSPVKH